MVSLPCFAAPVNSLQLSGNLQYLKYTEWDTNGSFLDSEKGWMPGLNLFAESFLGNRWVMFGAVDFYQGTTRYDGALNGTPPTPITSTTNNTFVDGSLAVGRIFQLFPGRIIPYAGVGGRYWRRGLTGTGAYLEKYRFLYFPVGARYEAALSEKIQIAADVSFFWNAGGRIGISEGGLSPVTGTLGSDFGFRLEAPVSYHLNAEWNLVGSIFFSTFGIGKGDPFELFDSNGVSQGTFLEPKSTTYVYGIRLGAAWIF